MKKLLTISVSFVVLSLDLSGQETDYGQGYQTLQMDNPALSGAEGDGKLRLSYLNFFPGNHYNLHSIHASYNSYFSELHGGAGVWVSNDHLGGIVNDLRAGASYAYFLRAGEELYINAALSAAIFHRGFRFGNAVLPDMIDPVSGISLPSGEALSDNGKTVFDAGAGFLFIYRNFFGGIAMNHLARPDISVSSSDERLFRKLLLHAAGNVSLNENRNVRVRPAGHLMLQGSLVSAGAGSAMEFGLISVNAMLLGNNNGNMNIQAGFAIRTTSVGLFYNYRFNVVSGSNLMPVSILHQTGVSISLNSVDKRSGFKTISLPGL